MKTLIALLLSTSAFAQCKFKENYDKMSGNYVVQTSSKVVEGSMMALEGSELSVSKVYNQADTNFFLNVSKVMKYQALNGGIAPRKIMKGSTVLILFEGDQRIELVALKEAVETQTSKKVGTLTTMMEYRHTFNIFYHIPLNLVSTLSQNNVVALRVAMVDDLGNPTFQDIEIREKSKSELATQLNCLIPRFYSK